MFSTRRFCTSLISRVSQTYIGIFGQTKMYKQTFWMRALGHPTPKRTTLFSNSGWPFFVFICSQDEEGGTFTQRLPRVTNTSPEVEKFALKEMPISKAPRNLSWVCNLLFHSGSVLTRNFSLHRVPVRAAAASGSTHGASLVGSCKCGSWLRTKKKLDLTIGRHLPRSNLVEVSFSFWTPPE